MSLSDAHADQIALLLNSRNGLTRTYSRHLVQQEADDYILRLSEDERVIAFVQLKKVQWYQSEILHLTVAEAYERKGHGKSLLCEAERIARSRGARLLQCTIREGNTESRGLFQGFGFTHVASYRNERSGNNVGVYQKVLAPAR